MRTVWLGSTPKKKITISLIISHWNLHMWNTTWSRQKWWGWRLSLVDYLIGLKHEVCFALLTLSILTPVPYKALSLSNLGPSRPSLATSRGEEGLLVELWIVFAPMWLDITCTVFNDVVVCTRRNNRRSGNQPYIKDYFGSSFRTMAACF